jgi:hypothetical protein
MAYARATRVAEHGMGGDPLCDVRLVMAAYDFFCALNMRDIAPMGILDLEGQRCTMPEYEPWSRARKKKFRVSDRTEEEKKSQKFGPKKTGPTTGLEPTWA